jgi:predicted dehydrogenase
MTEEAQAPVRIGCLGAARIAPAALIRPAAVVDGAVVSAVTARDPERARAFAAKHSIPRVYGTYQELIAGDDVDAVYIPLPNGMHGRWTMAALEAGKHVLCEKPFTANAEEAGAVAAAAGRSDRVVMEAFHWRYHPLAARLLEIIGSGELGAIRQVDSALCFPLPRWSDIRWQLDLAGGSLMDAGCYPVHIVRSLAGCEPTVVSARAKQRTPGVDRWIQARLQFPTGASGTVTAAMWSAAVVRTSARVVGETGSVSVINPQAPQIFNLLTVRAGGRTRRERVKGGPTYEYQLRSFVDAVRTGAPVLTPPAGSVANMTLIDEIYRAAGLQPRPVTAPGR